MRRREVHIIEHQRRNAALAVIGQPRASREPAPGADILIVPGLDNSGPHHWQSHWAMLAQSRRVELGDWAQPRLHEWVPALDRAVRAAERPLVLVGHSLGCIAIAWWASLRWGRAFTDKMKGALLVAPPDVDALDATVRIRDFRPLPRLRLPFPSVLVASRDDPYARFAWSRDAATAWGSDFVDLGDTGHINAESGLDEWPRGLRLLAGLTGHNPNLLVAELGLRRALA